MAKIKFDPRNEGLQSRAKETIKTIIEAATQLLEEKGAPGFSTNKIVERAGVSIGTLYQYFPNKEAILQFLVERLFNRAAENMVRTIEALDTDGADLEQVVARLVEQFFKNFDQEKNVYRQFLMSVVSVNHLKFMLKNDEKVAAALKAKFSPLQSEMREIDWNHSIFLVLYALKGIQFGTLFSEVSFDRAQTRREVAMMICRYLKVYPDSAPRCAPS